MKKLYLTAAYALIIILTLAFVSADIVVKTYNDNKDFTIAPGLSSVKVCSCGQQTDSFTIINSGTYAAMFTVGLDKQDDKVVLSQNSFQLNPRESTQVYIYYTAGCSQYTDDVNIVVSSNLGVVKNVQKSFGISKCQNIQVWLQGSNQSINPCTSASYTLFVQNVGPFADTYLINNNFDSNTRYSASSFILQPNQIAQVNAVITPACNVYGNQPVTFNVHSVKNNLEASITSTLSIARFYDYDINVNNSNVSSVDVCTRVDYTSIPITITNKGVDNTFKIDVQGLPSYARIENYDTRKPASIANGKSLTFNIVFDTSKMNKDYKTYNIKVNVNPGLGDIEKTKTFNINVKPCYDLSIGIENLGKNSAKAPLMTCADNLYYYDVDVVNKGIFTENIALTLSGAPSSVKLSTNNISLKPQDTGRFSIYIQGPETNMLYDVNINATLKNGLHTFTHLWFKSSDSNSCHLIVFDRSLYAINYDDKSLTVPIEFKGLTDGLYSVAYNGSILKTSVNELSFNTSVRQNLLFTINSFNMSQGNYHGTLILTHEATGTSYSQDISLKLKDKSAFRKTLEYFAFGSICRQFSLGLMVAILIMCILIILFMIYGPHYQYKLGNRIKMKMPVLIVLLVILLIGLALVIGLSGFPKNEQQVYNLTTNVSQLRFEILQDEHYTLDAAQFFYSPENNSLVFTVSGMSNVKSAVSGNFITLYPDLGFYGARNFTITANDRYGGSVKSPEMTLSVLQVPRKSTSELYNIYCWYVNLAIFAVLLILVFITFIVKQKRRTRK